MKFHFIFDPYFIVTFSDCDEYVLSHFPQQFSLPSSNIILLFTFASVPLPTNEQRLNNEWTKNPTKVRDRTIIDGE